MKRLIITAVTALSLMAPVSGYAASDLALDCSYQNTDYFMKDWYPNNPQINPTIKDITLRINFETNKLVLDEITGISFTQNGSLISYMLVGLRNVIPDTQLPWTTYSYTLNGSSGKLKSERRSYLTYHGPQPNHYITGNKLDPAGRVHDMTDYWTCRKVDALF